MEKLQTLTENQTTETLLNIPKLSKANYSDNEKTAIIQELISFAGCKQENISVDILKIWLTEFGDMNMNPLEVVKRIRLAKHERKFGASEFAIFMNVDLTTYSNFYKHKKTEFQKNIYAEFNYSIKIPNLQQLKKYQILYETETEVLIKNDSGHEIFYPKVYFDLIPENALK